MTTKFSGVIAAGFLAIGIVVGAAGTIVARDATTPDLSDHMGSRTGMTGSGSMGDVAGMMSMMGGGSQMSPDPATSPQDHESHHASPSPAASR